MIYLDTLWRNRRYANINGESVPVPFGVDLSPDLIVPFSRWIEQSGLEFCAKRVKALKTWALHILAGERDFREPWFKYIHYKGYTIPKLQLFKDLIDNLHNLKIVKLIMIVLNSYKLTMVGSPSLSSISGVERSQDPAPYIDKLRLYVDLPRVPLKVLEPVKSVDTKKKYADDKGETHPGPYGQIEDDFLRFLGASIEPKVLGRLIPIPDKGKWRVILVGHYLLQLRCKNLADWLRNWLWDQPEIASGDQNKMVRFCIESLKSERYMMSIDLSEATDRVSRHLQVALLQSMGVPRHFFDFLELPCVYRDKDFGGATDELKLTKYVNGQPMGLFVSFPMFELSHFVLTKWATAPYDAKFSICGDDLVIACKREDDAKHIFKRYSEIISRFGGKISLSKTLMSWRAAEGVGALFLKGYPKEIRFPSGKLSLLDARTKGTWLNNEIVSMGPVGRAIFYSWLSTDLEKRYTYQQRRTANESLVNTDLSIWDTDALRSLVKRDQMPLTYSRFDSEIYSFWRKTPDEDKPHVYHWVSKSHYRDSLVTNKIISLYKIERGLDHARPNCQNEDDIRL